MSEHITWLTPETHNRLVEELNERQGPIREAIKQRLQKPKLKVISKRMVATTLLEKSKAKMKVELNISNTCSKLYGGAPDSPDGEAHIRSNCDDLILVTMTQKRISWHLLKKKNRNMKFFHIHHHLEKHSLENVLVMKLNTRFQMAK